MSHQQWYISAPGVSISDATPENIVKFLLDHTDALIESFSEIESDGIIDSLRQKAPKDALFDLREYDDDFHAVGTFIAAIMANETHIGFESPGVDDTGKDCVIFPKAPPWQNTDYERNLTYDEFRAIIKRYADELGVTPDDDIELFFESA